MSLNIWQLSNGKKYYTALETLGSRRLSTMFTKSSRISPEDIRHYAPPKLEPIVVVPPDTAQYLGFGQYLYPELENKCGYNGHRLMTCVGPGCQVVGEGNPDMCPYWEKLRKEIGNA